MTPILILGGGGHAKVVIALIESTGEYRVIGIIDPSLKKDERVAGITVLGDETQLLPLYHEGIRHISIGVGSVKDNRKRQELHDRISAIGFTFPSLIHESAIIAKTASIGAGAQVMAGAIVGTYASIGENTIVNTGAQIDHDCRIGSHVHVAIGAIVAGEVVIKDGAFIGAGAAVIQHITIGANAVVGAGAAVIHDVPDRTTVVGVPAAPISS